MPTFIVLCNFEAGVDPLNLPKAPKALAEELMEQVDGATLDDLWLTTGSFDMIAVVEAADVSDALTFLMAFSSLGRVRTMTLTASSGVDRLVRQSLSAKTNVGGDGGG